MVSGKIANCPTGTISQFSQNHLERQFAVGLLVGNPLPGQQSGAEALGPPGNFLDDFGQLVPLWTWQLVHGQQIVP